MNALLCNVFNDPSSPWYYVIGILFLLLIFGALAAYIMWSNKRKNSNVGGETGEKLDACVNADINADSSVDADSLDRTTEVSQAAEPAESGIKEKE